MIAPTLGNTEWRKFKTLSILAFTIQNIQKYSLSHHRWGLEDDKHPKFAPIPGEPTAKWFSEAEKESQDQRPDPVWKAFPIPVDFDPGPYDLHIGDTYVMTRQVAWRAIGGHSRFWSIPTYRYSVLGLSELPISPVSFLNKTLAATSPRFTLPNTSNGAWGRKESDENKAAPKIQAPALLAQLNPTDHMCLQVQTRRANLASPSQKMNRTGWEWSLDGWEVNLNFSQKSEVKVWCGGHVDLYHVHSIILILWPSDCSDRRSSIFANVVTVEHGSSDCDWNPEV